MEKNNKAFIKSVRALLLMLMLLTLFTGAKAYGATIDVYLQVGVQTIPVNTFNNPEPITMWGYAQCTDGTFTSCGAVTVPGPTLTANQNDTLRIHVNNNLTGPFTEPTSVIIPGQTATMTPVWIDPATGAVVSTGSRPAGDVTSRIRSFTAETAVGGTTIYTWPSLKTGSYLYQSGTHPALQVQMGLYGALIVRTAGGAPYPGITAPNNEVTLLFSEIDPELHYSVASGLYGTPPPPPPAASVRGQRTSTEDYHPKYFLINGAPYSPALSPISAGSPGQSLLIRFLNAGLVEKTPTLQNQYMTIIAEDGNLLPYSKQQYSLLLPAGKTMDAIISPTTVGYIPVFDRSLNLTNATSSPGGMLVYLTVGAANQLLTVTLAGTGTGRVIATSLPGGIDCGLDCTENYVTGTVISLTAIPDPGISFGGWTGVDPGTEALNPATVTMNGNKNVTATFGPGGGGGPITLTSPNGGEVWQRGQTQTITWNYTGNPGPFVRIQATKGTKIRTIVFRAPIGSNGSGSFTKRIPPFFGLTGNDIKLVITVLADQTITDTSDDFFTINP